MLDTKNQHFGNFKNPIYKNPQYTTPANQINIIEDRDMNNNTQVLADNRFN